MIASKGINRAPEPAKFEELIYGDVDNAFRRLTSLLVRVSKREKLHSMTGFIYSRETLKGTPAHLVTSKFTGDNQRVMLDKDEGMSKLHFTITAKPDGTITSHVDHWI
ncbi:hypothetical protein HOU08_gp059 [Dickeya phage vB_DsoM_JA29]|uniref:Uncharacterized protein n=1 Tax=Dickeya phage vB_DsoM_JA29 TaxID=2283031 RepID=A0A384ZX44_9CAUD|nr:hypothetical protein HOU08_gp059 [Dickeya phage vB_DsoM_JA29]AXG66785.1 hypothetical protein JA29_059 [Dickeya phage vB_DsoM_JA29]